MGKKCYVGLNRDLISFVLAYFAYLRWAVTVSHGRGDAAAAGTAALAPGGPWSPASIHALRPRPKRHTLALIAPLIHTQ